MIDAIRFVQGAVARKDFVPVLKHFRIEDGRILSYNGVIALSAPIDLPFNVTPNAVQFARAIAACRDESAIALNLTASNRLGIRCGSFRAFVDCSDEPFPIVGSPPGDLVGCSVPFVEAMRAMWPFVSDDASRPWSLGMLIDGNMLIATNNVIAAEAEIISRGIAFADFKVAIPKEAIAEMIRIGGNPIGTRLTATGLTFHYDDGCWLQSRLLNANDWPPVRSVIQKAHDMGSSYRVIGADLRDAVERIAPFIGDDHRVFYGGTSLSTSLNVDTGAAFELEGPLNGQNIFNHSMLAKVVAAATHADFSTNVRCPFAGPRVRGVIIGMR